jgi:hypothetical protein
METAVSDRLPALASVRSRVHHVPGMGHRAFATLCLLSVAACTAAPLDAGSTGNDAQARTTAPTTRVTLHAAIDAMAIDATYIYFTSEDGFVYRLSRSGTAAPERIAAATVPGSKYTEGLATDEASLYWTALGDGVSSGAVLTAPKTGGSPVYLARGQARPFGIAVDDVAVYWANQGVPTPDQTNNLTPTAGILSVAKSGGSPTTLAHDVTAPDAIALDPTGVIWHESMAIRRVPKAGGTPMNLADSAIPWTSSNLVVSGSDVYWGADQGVWSLQSVGLEGGQVSTLVMPIDAPGGILIDGASLVRVVANGTDVGALESSPLAGGATTVVSAPDPVSGGTAQGAALLVADATAFYWVESWEEPERVVAVRTLAR